MKIAIVNDLPLHVEILKRVIQSDPALTLSWIAENGEEAVFKTVKEHPDLILMDLFMPILNGVEATKKIFHVEPTPILIVSALLEGHMEMVFEAMGAGALDVTPTPFQDKEGNLIGAATLLKKIHHLGRLTQRGGLKVFPPSPKEEEESLSPVSLLVIGASTGGPTAIASIFKTLPKDLNFAVIVIQHVDPTFLDGFIDWLHQTTGFQVVVAKPGDKPKRGVIHVASTDAQIALDHQGYFTYTPLNPLYNSPSIDHLFKSIAECRIPKGMAILLTGMGSDGATGLLELKKRGWKTVAQDEKSSVVFGMPKKALEIGAVDELLPLEKMAAWIEKGQCHG